MIITPTLSGLNRKTRARLFSAWVMTAVAFGGLTQAVRPTDRHVALTQKTLFSALLSAVTQVGNVIFHELRWALLFSFIFN